MATIRAADGGYLLNAEHFNYTKNELGQPVLNVVGGGGGGQSVQTDYAENDVNAASYLKNRPGGYYETLPGFNIEWDGVIGDRVHVNMNGATFVKVSDDVLTVEQLPESILTVHAGTKVQSIIIRDDDISIVDDIIACRNVVVIATKDNITVYNITFPEKGVYFGKGDQDGVEVCVLSLSKESTNKLVPIKGELTNIVGGYDMKSTNQPIINTTIPADSFVEKGGEYYYAPIQLLNPLYEGMIISGTITGKDGSDVNVSGKVTIDGNNYPHVQLYDSDNVEVAAIYYETDVESYVLPIAFQPTQPINVNLVQNGAAKKIIPKEYLDVSTIEEAANTAQITANNAQTTANKSLRVANSANTSASQANETANTAKTTADNAQSTANTARATAINAQSTANIAQTTANSIKPDWNVMDDTSKSYIANRPCYDITTKTSGLNSLPDIPNTVVNDGQTYYTNSSSATLNNSPIVDTGENYSIGSDETIYTATSVKLKNVFRYGSCIGNRALLLIENEYLTAATDGKGIDETFGSFDDTGENFVYLYPRQTTSTNPVYLFVKSGSQSSYDSKQLFHITREIKTLNDSMIPNNIQRVGGDLIVNSSTPDSTKKFRITVDDAGTITATEVTT